MRACGPEHQLVPDQRPRGQRAFGGLRGCGCVQFYERDAQTRTHGQGGRDGEREHGDRLHESWYICNAFGLIGATKYQVTIPHCYRHHTAIHECAIRP